MEILIKSVIDTLFHESSHDPQPKTTPQILQTQAIASALHHSRAEAMGSGGGEAPFALGAGAEVQKRSKKTTFYPQFMVESLKNSLMMVMKKGENGMLIIALIIYDGKSRMEFSAWFCVNPIASL